MEKHVDPITLEVMRNVLQSIAEEMGAALIRTALSTNIKDRRDCSSGIYTIDGGLVAQAEHIPLHLGLMPAVVKKVLEYYPPEQMQPGDAIMVNDPFVSGSHLPDISVLAPVFYQGKPVALVANLAHHVDVGGMTPGSLPVQATEIFQEGIRIPPMKVRKQGVFNDELVGFIKHNVRTPHEFEGDLQAQLAGCNVGERRLVEVYEKYGLEHMQTYMNGLMDYSNQRMTKELQKLPDGSWEFEDYLESDGQTEQQIPIHCKITIDGGHAVVDFTGSSPQVQGSINSTRAVTLACVYYAFKAVCDPDVPSNEGAFRPIEVITPHGSIVHPKFPAAVNSANANTAQRVVDAVLGAFSQFVPHRVPAASSGSMNAVTVGGIHPRTGKYYSYIECYGGGQGALYNQDGMDGVHSNMTNTRNAPVEVIETEYPIQVMNYSLAPLNGGEGKYRGGAGLHRELKVLDHDAYVTISMERCHIKPWGLCGGEGGTTSSCSLTDAEGNTTVLSSKFAGRVKDGSIISISTAGGGGYGSVNERDPQSIMRDVQEKLVSPERAKEIYGISLGK